MDTYKTIFGEETTWFFEKHSRFIGYVAHTETEEEAVAFIDKIRKEHSDARHNVYAYVLRRDNRMRYSDDGEPHGTAGMPVLDIINALELKDVTVVVTRYFGGILLGTGGLVRAYAKAAKDTLEKAEKYFMRPGTTYTMNCEYTDYGLVKKLFEQYSIELDDMFFEDDIKFTFTVPAENSSSFFADLTDTFSSRLIAEKKGEKYAKQKFST